MNQIQDTKTVKEQYQTANNLRARISLHEKYSTNKQGFGNWIFQNYQFFNGCKILELGCGTADMWRGRTGTIGKASLLVLSDFSSGMLEEAKHNVGEHPNVIYKQIDIMNIPYNENEFDFVIANMMLHHVSDVPAAIKEVRRVLKPTGIFTCAAFGENGISKYFNDVLAEQRVHININDTFTMQNGAAYLSKEFMSVQRLDYIDSFEITDTNDLVDYFLSLSSIVNKENLNRNDLYHLFERTKDDRGIINIPKEYGMFIAQ